MNATLRHITKVYPFQELKFLYANSKTPEAVVLPYDDFLGLMETLLIINDKKLMSSIKRGLRDVKEGKLLTHSEVFD
jgi:PHD/YefM family antitoxin component YafN of YafNO toxin-antitoxin module